MKQTPTERAWGTVRAISRCGPASPLLFHYRRKASMAWIGSANFTAHGMAVNTELMHETDDAGTVASMSEWFDEAWNNCAPNAKDVFGAYRKRDKPPQRYVGDRGGVPSPRQRLQVRPDENQRYLLDLRQRGSLRFEYFGENRWAESYAEIARNVLVAFAAAETSFLRRFAEKDAERVGRGGAWKRYLSTDRGQIGRNPPTVPLATRMGRWWMAQQLQDYHFFQGSAHAGTLKMACEVLGVAYEEGDAGPIDFQKRNGPAPPSGFRSGEIVLVRIGKRAEIDRLGPRSR